MLIDGEGRFHLELEAGTDGFGPTYRLYAAQVDDETFRRASPDLDARHLVLVPITRIGLDDDHEDELGMPWAYPLEPLRWAAG